MGLGPSPTYYYMDPCDTMVYFLSAIKDVEVCENGLHVKWNEEACNFSLLWVFLGNFYEVLGKYIEFHHNHHPPSE